MVMARPFEKLAPQVERLSQGAVEVLFIHGAWHGAWCWGELATRVAGAGYGVSLLELPGHGPHAGANRWRLPGTTSLTDYALLAARAAGDLGRPILVGHSMGGWICQKIWEVADLPGVLIAPVPAGGLPLKGLLRLFMHYPDKMAGVMLGHPLVWNRPEMVARLFFARREAASLGDYVSRMTPEPPRVALELGLGLARARPGLGRSPRLVIAAGRDYFMPVAALQSLARRLGAGLAILPEAGHNPWLEDPGGEVLGLVKAFLRRAASHG